MADKPLTAEGLKQLFNDESFVSNVQRAFGTSRQDTKPEKRDDKEERRVLEFKGEGLDPTRIGQINAFLNATGDTTLALKDLSFATTDFLSDNVNQARQQLNYLYAFRNDVQGISFEELAQKNAIGGQAGQLLTQMEQLMAISSGFLPDELAGEYLKIGDTNVVSQLFRPGEIGAAFSEVFNEISGRVPNALSQLNGITTQELLTYQKAFKLSNDEIASLIQKQYAFSGEVNSDIIGDIGQAAVKVSEATGLTVASIKEDIIDITTDVQTFGDIGAESAARLSAGLSQVGLDVSTLKSMLTKFENFDTAAEQIGDLSAMFGIQLDAMEMTYLANEDQEEFLFRMREEVIDAGLDVENMSHARQKMLADSMGLNVMQMQTFMREGELMQDQMDLTQATSATDEMSNLELAFEKFADKQEKAMRSTSENLADLRIASLSLMRESFVDLSNVSADAYLETIQKFKIQEEIISAQMAMNQGMTNVIGNDEFQEGLGKVVTNFNNAVEEGLKKLTEGVKALEVEIPEFEMRNVVTNEYVQKFDETTLGVLNDLVDVQNNIIEFEQAQKEDLSNLLSQLETTSAQNKAILDYLNSDETKIVMMLDGKEVSNIVMTRAEQEKGTLVSLGLE